MLPDRQQLAVTLLTDSFPPHAGGSRIYYYNLFRRLSEYPETAVRVLTKKVPGWKEFDATFSTPSFRIQRHFKPLPNLRYEQLPKAIFPMGAAFILAVGSRIDVCFSGDLYPQGLAVLSLKKSFGIPYVAFAHGEEITSMERLRFQWRYRNMIYRNADAVIANGAFTVDKLLEMGIEPRRIHKLSPGIDPERFRPIEYPRELALRHDCAGKFVLLTISRIIPRKGHAAVLRAISMLPADMRDSLRYLIAGKGPEESRLRELTTALSLQSVVEFVGFVPEAEMNAYYNLCDIFVMPNREENNGEIEGFGMVFIEANAAGKPVIAGRSGGTEEAVVNDRTGFLVEPDNPQELSATLRHMICHPDLRAEMGRTGHDRAVEQFSWGSRAASLHEIALGLKRRRSQ